MLKNSLIFLLGVVLAAGAQAQGAAEEDYTLVLPEAAQQCVLPVAPDAIPLDADYETLVTAKQHVADFQASLGVYRECLAAAEKTGELTAGNRQALASSYNYSVDMEERVAQRFNEAVRAYKERKAEQ